MPVNLDKPLQWKADRDRSVDSYNQWFMLFAPQAYRETRIATTREVAHALDVTANLTNVAPNILRQYPQILPILRMSTSPPLARDRLIGLAGVQPGIVKAMEHKTNPRIPPKITAAVAAAELTKIADMIIRLADPYIFPWLASNVSTMPDTADVYRASTIVADRLCGANADPIIRNAQEKRQLAVIKAWLEVRGYKQLPHNRGVYFTALPPGTFTFRLNVTVKQGTAAKPVNMPIDVVITPLNRDFGATPLLIEAKSAGDFTNTNKRRKEEATKFSQLRATYGDDLRFILFLNGYFDTPTSAMKLVRASTGCGSIAWMIWYSSAYDHRAT